MKDLFPLLALLALLVSPPLLGRFWEWLDSRRKTRLDSAKTGGRKLWKL
jgi:hypothetical protein